MIILTPIKHVFWGKMSNMLCKFYMYDHLYNYRKDKYGKNAKLLFTDTDNVTYEIETNGVN